MKDKILSLFTNPSEMTPEQIVLNIGIAAVLGFFIFISYYISHRGTIYSKKFNAMKNVGLLPQYWENISATYKSMDIFDKYNLRPQS